MKNINQSKYGEPYSGDSKFVASCRLLQSIYRSEIGESIRPYIGRDRNYCLGNYIDGGDVSGGGASTNTKGNCTAVECIKKINPEHTVEQINNIIGFEGELLDEKYQKYRAENVQNHR